MKHKFLYLFTVLLLLALLANIRPAVMVQAQGSLTLRSEQDPSPTISLPPITPVKNPEDGSGQTLGAQPHGIAAVANGYDFSSSSGVYAEITGGTQVTKSCDDGDEEKIYTNLPIGFDFIFDEETYNTFSIECNGFIAMGANISISYYPISTGTTDNVIVALGNDQQTGASDSEIRFEVLGTAPDRELVVQYKNFRHYSGNQTYNFQIQLFETSNVIQVVYGLFNETTAYTEQVGLRGVSNADFNNRMTGTWADSLPGTDNTSSMTLSPVSYPDSGLTYTWTPRTPPNLSTSTKSAPTEVLVGDPISYTIHINNTGTGPADSATLTDTLPLGTTYLEQSLFCSSGACSYAAGEIGWRGAISVGESVTVTFQVAGDGLKCGTDLVNTAVINDPQDLSAPYNLQATTRLVSVFPAFAESFDEVTFPPVGWSAEVLTGTYNWVRATAGIHPTIAPHSGAGMAAYNAYDALPGSQARLVFPVMDLTPGYAVAFYMSHDTGYSTANDNVQVQVSTDGGLTWLNVGAPITRYNTAYTVPGWGWHAVNLTDYRMDGILIGLLATSEYGNNVYLDDVTLAVPWYPCPLASFTPDQANVACRALDVTYNLMAATNYLTDTYAVGVSGNTWPTLALPPLVDLPISGSAPVTVTVHVPWDTAVGTSDVVTVSVTGQSTNLSDSATVATTAIDQAFLPNWQSMTGDPTLFWGASYYEDGNVCVVGGLTGNTLVVSDIQRCYDISAGSWFTRTGLPTGVFAPAYGWIDGKFYVAGGFVDTNFNATDLVQIYSPISNTWDTVSGALLPSARGGQANGVVAGKLYSAGGSAANAFPSDCPTYEYDPIANSWTSLADCPLQGGYGLDLGGSVGSSYYHKLFAGGHSGAYFGWYAFDPVADSWETLADLPVDMNQTPLIVEDPNTGLIYQVGALNGAWTPQAAVNVYDYGSDSWYPAPPDLPAPMGGLLGPPQGSFGDPDFQGFWAVGGTAGTGSLNSFQAWQYMICPAVTPALDVTPPVLQAEQCTDTITTQAVQICNAGLAPFSWASSETLPISWLSTNPVSGTLDLDACQTVTATFDSTSLAWGDYTADLTVMSNDPDRPVITMPVTLTVGQPADFTWMPPTPIVSETVSFMATAAGPGPITFQWDFGDGSLGSGQYPRHTYSEALTHTVVMTATGECSGLQVVTHLIQVAAACTELAGVDYSWTPTVPSVGTTVAFSGTLRAGTGPLTWEWDFGDGTTGTGQFSEHVYAEAGDYTVILTVSNGCGIVSASYDIAVSIPLYLPAIFRPE